MHQRVSIPLEYVALGRAGNSATSDQIDVLDRALGYLSAGHCCLLADREFIGRGVAGASAGARGGFCHSLAL